MRRRRSDADRTRSAQFVPPSRLWPLLLLGIALAALLVILSPSGPAAAQTASGLVPPATLHVYEGQGQVTVTLTGTVPTGRGGNAFATLGMERTATHSSSTSTCADGDDFLLNVTSNAARAVDNTTDLEWTGLTLCDDSTHELPETIVLEWGATGTPYDSSADNCDTTSSCTTMVYIVDNDANAAGEFVVPDSWPLKPSALVQNDRFRLLIFTTNQASQRVSGISHYNTHVRNDVKNTGGDHIKFFGDAFRVVGSTSGVSARVNTNMWDATNSVWRDGSTSSTKTSGIQINWLNGKKIADSYADFCDDSWASIEARDPAGTDLGDIGEGSGIANAGAATGSNDDCTSSSEPLGNLSGWVTGMQSNGGLNTRRRLNTPDFSHKRNLGMSPVFRVQPPTVSVALEDDGSLTRNAAGQGVFTEAATSVIFVISRDKAQATGLTVCVKVEESGGNMIPASSEGTVTVAIAANSKTLRYQVNIPADTNDEINSVVTATVLPPSDASCSQTGYMVSADNGSDAAFIEDNDATVVSLSSSDTTMTEQRAADTAVVTVSLSRNLGAGEKLVVPLTLATTTGAALPDAAAPDFAVAASGTRVTSAGWNTTAPTLTFTGHATDTVQTATITFTPTNRDDGDITDETINVGLDATALGMKSDGGTNLGGAGAPHSTNNAVALMIDDDESEVSFSSATYSADEGDQVTVTVNISPVRDSATTLSITSTLGSGQGFAGSGDFTGGPYSVTIPADTGSADFTIRTTEDTADEPNETFIIAFDTLPTSIVLGTTTSATVTINDDDVPAVTMTAVASTITEGGTAQFRLAATPAPYQNTTINVTVADSGSFANSGQAGSRTVTIGTSGTATLSVTTDNDSADEADGTITATVTSGTGYAGAPSAVVTVNDNDVPSVTIARGTSPVTEGTAAAFTLTASPTPYQDISVTVNISQSGSYADSTAARTVTIGTSGSASLSIDTTDDSLDETNGSVTATLAAPGADAGFELGAMANRMATVAVEDDDVPAITITAAAATITEGADARFTLTASPKPYQDITVNVNISQSGSYAASTAARMVTVGTSGTATLRIATTDDNTDEADGSVTATVAAGTGYTGTPTATVAVDDDDVPVVRVTAGSDITEGGTATFTLTASPTPYQTITVNVDVADAGDFATAGQTGSRMVSMTTSGSASLSVTTVDDDNVEDSADISVTVAAGTGYTPGRSARVAVGDNDARLVEIILPAGSPDYSEGSGQPIEFSVAAESSHNLYLDYSLVWGYGTAVHGMDFKLERWRRNSWEPMGACVSGLGTWLAPGEISHRYRLIILNDDFEETRERIGMSLSSGSSRVVLGRKDFVPEIPANDSGGPQEPRWWTAQFREASSTVDEDAGEIRVAIYFTQPVPCTPNRHTFMDIQFEGSATIGEDYTIPTADKKKVDWRNTARTLPEHRNWYMVSAREGDTRVKINLIDDNTPDNGETIVVRLLPGHHYDIGDRDTHTITIRNHDPDPGPDPDPAPLTTEQTASVEPASCTIAPTADDLVDLVRSYHDANKTRADYSQNWFRVLIALGEETSDTLTPFTAAEAKAGEQIWDGWTPVRVELERLEQAAADCAATPEVTIAAGSAVTEGNAATFTLTASPKPASSISVRVDITQSGSYATSTAQRTVTISTSGTATLSIDTTSDSTDEPDGSVTAAIAAGTGYTGSGSATVTVRDDDDPPPSCTITPTADDLANLVRSYHDANKTRADYNQNWFRVLIAFGEETSGTLTPLTVAEAKAGEQIWGGWEPVRVELERLEQTAADCTASQTEQTLPPPPAVSIVAGAAVTEGSAATFTLTASPKPSSSISVRVDITQSGDYATSKAQGTVTIGTSGTATLSIPTTSDSTDEPDGSVTATIASGTGYTGSGSATVAVRDDDVPAVSIAAGSAVTEGSAATFTLTASPKPASSIPVKVDITQSGSYATSTAQRTVTIGTSGTVTLSIATTNDNLDEANGSITATIAAGTGYTGSGPATVTVNDDDPPAGNVGISIENASGLEGREVVFRVTLSEAASHEVRVSWKAAFHAAGTASAVPGEYWRMSGTLVFQPGDTAASAAVYLEQDTWKEDDETFLVELSGPHGATIARGTGVMTITDDD